MTMHNAKNERVKRRYLAYLKEARRHSEVTVDAAAKAIAQFEAFTSCRDFRLFHIEQAIAFKRRLAGGREGKGGKPLSKATQYATLSALKKFFAWLADQPGYRSRLKYSDADYFNLSDKDSRVATTRRERPFPTVEQVKHVLRMMPAGSEVERRNRALVAFTLLTGARDGAIASLKLKHVDLQGRSVYQDAREVNTKFSKSFPTYFFAVGDEVLAIFEEWVLHLQTHLGWSGDAPLFPATLVELGEGHQFQVTGLRQEHWRTTTPIRAIFRHAFTLAGLPYHNPHSLRRTLVQLGEMVCQTPEEFKAWSQNLGHEDPLTTFTGYGAVGARRQGELIRDLQGSRRAQGLDVEELARRVVRELRIAEGSKE